MEQLVFSLQNLLVASWDVLISVLGLVVPWIPLVAWVAFWLLAVNWEKLYPVLAKGGIIGVLLIGVMVILVWGLIAPPEDGLHHFFHLQIANFVGKTVYVTMLLAIMVLCGSVQLSGACGTLVRFPSDDDHDDEASSHGETHASHSVGEHSHHDVSHHH